MLGSICVRHSAAIVVLVVCCACVRAETLSFAAPVKYQVPTPVGVGVSDLNGDGRPDIAVVNNSGSSVSILLNSGMGTFGPAGVFPTAGNPSRVVLADFNRDGLADLATSHNSNPGLVSVLTNTGNSLSAPSIFAAGKNAWGFASADFNKDGRDDLVVSNNDFPSNALQILLNTSTSAGISFQGPTGFGTQAYNTELAVGDLNNDGIPDAVVANPSGGDGQSSFMVYISRGDGSFYAPVSYAGTRQTLSVVLGDVNSDGKLDVLVNHYISSGGFFGRPPTVTGRLDVCLNKGDGTFTFSHSYDLGPVRYMSHVLALGDLRRSGKLDLVYIGASTISIMQGNGNGTFSAPVLLSNMTANEVKLADVNQDGNLDLLASDSGNNALAVFLNNAPPAYPPTIGSVPPVTLEQESAEGTTYNLGLPKAFDYAGRPLEVISDAPGIFPPGTTVVTFSAKDAWGKEVTSTTSVTVVDTTPPVVTAPGAL
ncbi:MAG TPA: VCBS repeat-containing protein, partial [Planctomycetota bacterium]|nr:VCBS repeat-containing protein [Planctomycetota bacterium]